MTSSVGQLAGVEGVDELGLSDLLLGVSQMPQLHTQPDRFLARTGQMGDQIPHRPRSAFGGTVTVKVCDDADGCDEVSFHVTVQAPAPIAAVIQGPTQIGEGGTGVFRATGSTGEGDLTFAWDLDGDGDHDDATGEQATLDFTKAGSTMIGLQVTDSLDRTAISTHTVTITAVAPTVKPIKNQKVEPGEKFSLSGSFTDPGDNTWTATVDYGDGPVSLNLDGKTFALTHAYHTAGVRTVTVQVCDDQQACGSTSFTATVPELAKGTKKDDPSGVTLPVIGTLPMTGNPVSLTSLILALLALVSGGILIRRRRAGA